MIIGQELLGVLSHAHKSRHVDHLVLFVATVVLFGVVWLLGPALSIADPLPVLLSGIALFCLIGYASFHNERVWVYLAVIAHGVLFISAKEEAIGVGEIVYAVVVLGGLVIWFVKSFIRRERLVRNGFDVALLVFSFLGAVIAAASSLLHSGDMVAFVKEWAVILDLLLYFPLRKVINSRGDVYVILALFFVVAAMNSVFAVLTYQERLADAVFQWQLKARSNVNEVTSIALFVLSTVIFAYHKNRIWGAFGLVGAAVGLCVLVISYSRGPIVSGILAIAVVALLIPLSHARRVVVAFVCGVIVGFVALIVVYPNAASIITSAIGTRIATLSSMSSDLSLHSRVVESEWLIEKYIPESPIIGYGYGVPYRFPNPISHRVISVLFVHNGYLWAAFKYGIPLAMMLMWVIAYPIIRLLRQCPSRNQGFDRAIIAACAGYTIGVLLMNITSSLFAGIAAMMNFAYCWALLDYVVRSVRSTPDSRNVNRPHAGSQESAFGP